MSREWQPGDLAILEDGTRVFVAIDLSDDTLSAINARGGWYSHISMAARAARPLAVVDPEQPIPDEWVDVFREGFDAAWEGRMDWPSAIGAGLAALFAHIANPHPPTPAEPTNFGACVRTRGGVEWCRIENSAVPWRDGSGVRAEWDDLDIPEDGILWHGVGGDS